MRINENIRRLISFSILIMVAYGLVLMSSNFCSFEESIRGHGQTDIRAYRALAIQENPFNVKQGLLMQRQRIFWPYVGGALHRLTGISVDHAFLLLVIASQVTMLICLLAIYSTLKIHQNAQGISLLLLMFNPYVFRYYLAHSGMLPGTMFMMGITIVCLGLVRKSVRYIYAGLLIAVLARQTALLMVPALWLWIWMDEDWKAVGKKNLMGVSLWVATIPLIVYFWTAKAFSGDFLGQAGFVKNTWFDHWANGYLGGADLLRYFLRLVHLFWTELLVVLLLCWKRQRFSVRTKPLLLFVLCLSIMGQTLTQNAGIEGNIMRYFWQGYPVLAILLALWLDDLFFKIRFEIKEMVVLTSFLFIGSFHHIYSILVVVEESKPWFFVTHKISGLIFVALLGLFLYKKNKHHA